jgi:hypothetical protein
MQTANNDGLQERTAADVHATLCAMVKTRATHSSAWADYAEVLLGSETVAFFEARLQKIQTGTVDDAGSSEQKSKTLQRNDAIATDAGIVCEYCGGAVPQIVLRVASMDGIMLDMPMSECELVREVKRRVGQVLRSDRRA